jgi:type IV pilus assembly protein PilA
MGADGNNMTSMGTGNSEMSVGLASNEAPKTEDPMTTWQRMQPVLSSTHRLDALRGVSAHSVTDAGFTLIELMVVLLILAILLAIAIPTFLGVTRSANDRAAQSNLNTAMINAKAAYQTLGQTYNNGTSTVNAATLGSAEPSLSFVAGLAAGGAPGASTGQGVISVFAPTDGNSIVLAAYAVKTKNCWVIVDNPAIEGSTAAPFSPSTTGNLGLGAGTAYYKFSNVASTACNAGNFGVAYTTTQTNGFPS